MNPPAKSIWLALTVALVILQGCGDLTSGELDRGIGALESAAAEGALVAGQVAEDRTKTTFARVRARELSEDVEHEAEKLADATPEAGQRGHRDQALELAEKVGEALQVLQVYPEDEKRASEAEQDLKGLTERLSTLEERE